MEPSELYKVIALLSDSFKSLQVQVPPREIEKIAILIHKIMNYQTREFHSIEHVFGFGYESDPVFTLAALFHDIIYLQVDGGLPGEVLELLLPYVRIEKTNVSFISPVPDSRLFFLCCDLFNKDPSRPVSSLQGMNEFLSALAMMLLLHTYVPEETLIAVATCIEASIPFRGPDPEGKPMGNVLEERLKKMKLFKNEALRKATIHRAIRFANQDVQDFVMEDPAAFLSNSWKLLPESNVPLRGRKTYTIHEYRIALNGMLRFFQSLQPEFVFHAYDGVPSETEMQEYTQRIRKNIGYGVQYLKAKLLAVAILEGLAELTGGDVPLVLFIGDESQCKNPEDSCLLHFLPKAENPNWLASRHPVIRLLQDGRLEKSSFDIRTSPFATWLYKRLRPEEWAQMASAMDPFFSRSLPAQEFLSLLPKDPFDPTKGVLTEIVEACAQIVPTRREALLSILVR
jgi:hypothetical protein